MTTHQMHLQPQYFNFIKHGTKRIELHLYDEKRQIIQLVPNRRPRHSL